MNNTIEQIARRDGRYDPRALVFVHEGLGHTIQAIKELTGYDEDKPRHITGAELARGLARIAMDRWGRLAKIVLAHWGIHSTRDLGEIVYLMIECNWMSAQESDRIEDFDDVFSFDQFFEQHYQIKIS